MYGDEGDTGEVTGFDEDSAAAALMERWEKSWKAATTEKIGVSEGEDPDEEVEQVGTEEEGAAEEAEEGASEEDAPEGEEGDAAAAQPAPLSDEAEIDFGDGHKLTVAEIKRRGQELAEAAQRRQQYESSLGEAQARLKKLVERAQARADKYKDIDFDVLAKDPNWTADDIRIIKAEMREAQADLDYLNGEFSAVSEETAKAQHERLIESAKAAHAALTDPKHPAHIPGWGQETWQGLIKFAAESLGFPPEKAARETNPSALKLLWMAQQYAEGKAKAKQKLKPREKAVPQKSQRPGSGAAEAATEGDEKKALKRLMETGDEDDAAAVFLQRMRKRRE